MADRQIPTQAVVAAPAMDAAPPGIDVFLANPNPNVAPISTDPATPPGLDQFLAPEMLQEKHGGLGQQAIAAVEGVGKGVLGPIAPAVETAFGVDPEAIRGRAEANPITHGVGEAAGLIGGLAIPGGGQAGLLTKVGKGAQELAGLAKVAEGSKVLHKVGSLAVAQAAEMAVYQAGDEVAKAVLKDPDQTAETAIANIGLATALGGSIGAGFGTISPLWKATVGPKFEKALTGLREHLDGGGKLRLPEEIESAQKALGIEISPATRAGMSGDPKAAALYNELRESQNASIINDIKTLESASSDTVSRSLGVDPSDVLAYDEAEIGHNLKNTFLKEYKGKYGPVSDQLAKRDLMAEGLAVTDDARLKLYGDLLEKGMEKVGTDSPFYKLYHDYGNRILAKDTIAGLDKLSTEIGHSIRTLGTNNNEKIALQDIQASLRAFKEEQVLAKGAVEGLDTLAMRTEANEGYKQFAEMSDKLSKHLGTGEFRGYKGLVDKLSEGKSAEQLLRSFSPKGDADLIPFLKTHFPDTFKVVQENEIKKLLKPAILAAKGDNAINVQKLASIIEKGMAGEKSYIEAIIPPEALQKIQAAATLANALPSFKSSGTAGMLSKLYKNMPASAMAAVGWLTGNVGGVLPGYLVGTMAQWLGREAPDAIKLATLKFLASEQPVKAEGFKAMVDFVANTYKGSQMLDKAASNIFKPTIRVLRDAQMPTTRQIAKIERMVADYETNPQNSFNQNMQQTDMAYYLPAHQVAVSKSSSNALAYLSTLKPKPFKTGPLDAPIEPSGQEKARYYRALEVAQSPGVVLQRVKDGTLLPSDITDIKTMYPALYNSMVQQVSNQMINRKSEDEPIAYKTRVGLSLFLGQPIDSSMRPEAILKAQPVINPEEHPQQGPTPSRKPATNSFKKLSNSSMTSTQGAEAARRTRD